MANMTLLICDNETSKVEQLQTVLGEEFEYIHKKTIIEFEAYITNNQNYHAVFLDLHFGETFTLDLNKIIEIKRRLNPYSKFIIYTAFTINHIDLIKNLSQMGIIDEWVDIEELRYKDKMPSAKLRLLNCLSYAADVKDGLWLIHLSDLHFGKQFKIRDEDIREGLVDLIVNQIKSNISEGAACKITKPSIIITSGDLSHTSEPSDFLAYKNFHVALIDSLKKLKVEYPISVIAPGNHDFSWRISIIEENNVKEENKKVFLTEEKVESEYIKSLKWKPFIDNINELQNATVRSKDNFTWWIFDYSKRLGINIFSINSSKNFTYKSSEPVFLNYSVIRELETNCKIIDKQLGILVIHHPVDKWGDEKTCLELLKYLYSKLNIRLIFSGHKHRGNIIRHKVDANSYILEIQTGSSGSNEKGQPIFQLPNYRIINLKKDITNDIWQKVESFTFSYQDGSFIIQPKNTGGSYSESETISGY